MNDRKRHGMSCLLLVIVMMSVWLLILIVMGLIFAAETRAAGTDGSIDVRFRGTLTAGACVLDTESENIGVPFPDLPGKYFRLNDRGPERRFRISLRDCDTGRSVRVRFSGVSASAPGLEGTLKLNSPQSGLENQLGIQLAEYVNGQRAVLELSGGGVTGAVRELARTTETLEFGAWLKPSGAVRSGAVTVSPGEYRAVLTFDLIYD